MHVAMCSLVSFMERAADLLAPIFRVAELAATTQPTLALEGGRFITNDSGNDSWITVRLGLPAG